MLDVKLILLGTIIFIFLVIIYLLFEDKFTNKEFKKYLLAAEKASGFLNYLKKREDCYLTKKEYEENKEKYKSVYDLIFPVYKKLNRSIDFVEEFVKEYENYNREKINKEFVNKEIDKCSDLFDDINGNSLDLQQRKAIVVNEDSNLIIAGAGCGKTLTMTGKVNYLVKYKKVDPKEILLVTFTKKAAEDMKDRVCTSLSTNINTYTFHKLGLEVISHALKTKPEINKDLKKIVHSFLKQKVLENKKIMNFIVEFFAYYINTVDRKALDLEEEYKIMEITKDATFETIRSKVMEVEERKQKKNRLKDKKIITIKKEEVKSIEELVIANFLFLNGINYCYEREYEVDTSDEWHCQYKPDFYLPDFNIYIEHFGINKDGRVPWLNKEGEEKYIESIRWKRETHAKHKTILVETYSYEIKNRLLFQENLLLKLKELGVRPKKMDYGKIYKEVFINNKSNKQFIEFEKLLENFIQLFKSNNYEAEMFAKIRNEISKEDSVFIRDRNSIFMDIVEPIYRIYQQYLKKKKAIDFNDMINQATKLILDGKSDFIKNYKYILVDEYQDTSISKYEFIRAIKNKNNAHIFCFGDDWQSIYRFTGTNINIITRFDKYFKDTEIVKIEKTYRNSQELIDVAANFIMKNPSQISKYLKSDKKLEDPIKILYYNNQKSSLVSKYEKLMEAIYLIVKEQGEDTSILLLGRNNFDINFLDYIKYSKLSFKERFGQDIIIQHKDYKNLKIKFMTIHKSKGLEDENVIILNCEDELNGFPNKIADDMVLKYLLEEKDPFSFAEERRLFYVALTRTKNLVYLIVPQNKMSIFVKELINRIGIINDDEAVYCKKCPVFNNDEQ